MEIKNEDEYTLALKGLKQYLMRKKVLLREMSRRY